MNKRKLRRVAIVALVLVLLCNTLGVQASTKKDGAGCSPYFFLPSMLRNLI